MADALSTIFGQPRAVEQLARALERDTLHHAYLFQGPEGVGKHRTARALAQAINCASASGKGCGTCEPCRKIADDLHPDVVWFAVLPEKGQSERVRDLLPRLSYPPNEGRRRVVVLDPADELNQTAANIFLKTLEEPPPHTQFVLVTARPASLLVTIRSRCQRVVFTPLDEALIARELVATHDVAQQAARDAAAMAQGSLGKALELVSSEEFPRRRDEAHRLITTARTGTPADMLALIGELGPGREEAAALIDLMWITYRDALLVGTGVAAGRLGEARLREASSLAEGLPVPALLGGLRALREAARAIDGYVSPQLALEALVLDLGQARAHRTPHA